LKAELVVWGETVLSEPVHAATLSPHIKERFAGLVGVPLVFGAIVAEDMGRLRNSALITDPAGAVMGRYDKHFLVPIGEYLPLERELPIFRTLFPRAGTLQSGDSTRAPLFGGGRLAIFICYEDLLAGYVNRLVSGQNVDLLVNLSNDGWFDGTVGSRVHLAHARLRAI
jgi:apolipoprotein N-acyltransferase